MFEKTYQILFGHWLKARWGGSGIFELKAARNGISLPFSEVKEHQITALEAANEGGRGLYYKIPDSGMGWKPADCFILRDTPAFVVIFFSRKEFYMISIASFIKARAEMKRKSFRREDCIKIGIKCSL